MKSFCKIVNSPFPKLSDREIQILTMIVGEKTTQEIAENLLSVSEQWRPTEEI
ncbi:MAG: hypothetical protein IPG18_07675 [Saprospiraceae bacterium]|nr:hypothetical protein [Saprospiraceae bacterium]